MLIVSKLYQGHLLVYEKKKDFDLIMTGVCVFQMLDIYFESKKFQLPDDVTLETMCVK